MQYRSKYFRILFQRTFITGDAVVETFIIRSHKVTRERKLFYLNEVLWWNLGDGQDDGKCDGDNVVDHTGSGVKPEWLGQLRFCRMI